MNDLEQALHDVKLEIAKYNRILDNTGNSSGPAKDRIHALKQDLVSMQIMLEAQKGTLNSKENEYIAW